MSFLVADIFTLVRSVPWIAPEAGDGTDRAPPPPVHRPEAVPGPLLVTLAHSIALRLVAPKVESWKTTEAAKRAASISSVHSPQAKFDERRA